MSLVVIFAASLLAGQSAPVRTISESPTSRVVVEGSADDAGGQRVCVWEAPMGSNVRRRVCRTERLIRADRQEGRDMLRRAQGLPELGTDPTPGF